LLCTISSVGRATDS